MPIPKIDQQCLAPITAFSILRDFLGKRGFIRQECDWHHKCSASRHHKECISVANLLFFCGRNSMADIITVPFVISSESMECSGISQFYHFQRHGSGKFALKRKHMR
jgi:hypothetical protein